MNSISKIDESKVQKKAVILRVSLKRLFDYDFETECFSNVNKEQASLLMDLVNFLYLISDKENHEIYLNQEEIDRVLNC